MKHSYAKNGPEKQDKLGNDMIRSIFGPEAIAEDQFPQFTSSGSRAPQDSRQGEAYFAI
jgi:hypothetical protein